MTSFTAKPLLIVDCIICWTEILVVLIIDSIIMRITVYGASSTCVQFFVDAVMCMFGLDQKEELIIFLSLHLTAHGIWLIASIIMVVGIFMVQSPSTVGISFFFITSCLVSLLDLASTIYFSIETSKVYGSCSESLFFPLFFCKGVLLWIANPVMAIHVLTFQKQIRNRDIKSDWPNRHQTIYSLPWDSYTDLLIPSPVVSPPEVPQPRSIMKNPNDPNYHSRQISVKFKRSTSIEFINSPEVETDFTTEVFRSTIRYSDVTEDYKYWDSYVHTHGETSP